MPAVLPLRPLVARGGCWKEASLNTSYSGSGTTFSFAASGKENWWEKHTDQN
jgi:hypothetical protein